MDIKLSLTVYQPLGYIETSHLWPYFLPDGRYYLYLAWSAEAGNRAIYAGSLDSEDTTRVLAAESMPVYAEPGYLFFQRQGALFAQLFDTAKLQVSGEAARLADGISRDVATRLTFDTAQTEIPVWSPDGLTVAYSSNSKGNMDIFTMKSSGVGQITTLLDSDVGQFVDSWSRDGRYLAYASQAGNDLYVLPLFGDRKPFPVVQSPGRQDEPHFSPDGKWLAYHSNESGVTQVYVISFPAGDQKRQISTTGGGQPRWRRDGKELFYLGLDGNLLKPVTESTPTPITAGVNWTAALNK